MVGGLFDGGVVVLHVGCGDDLLNIDFLGVFGALKDCKVYLESNEIGMELDVFV